MNPIDKANAIATSNLPEEVKKELLEESMYVTLSDLVRPTLDEPSIFATPSSTSFAKPEEFPFSTNGDLNEAVRVAIKTRQLKAEIYSRLQYLDDDELNRLARAQGRHSFIPVTQAADQIVSYVCMDIAGQLGIDLAKLVSEKEAHNFYCDVAYYNSRVTLPEEAFRPHGPLVPSRQEATKPQEDLSITEDLQKLEETAEQCMCVFFDSVFSTKAVITQLKTGTAAPNLSTREQKRLACCIIKQEGDFLFTVRREIKRLVLAELAKGDINGDNITPKTNSVIDYYLSGVPYEGFEKDRKSVKAFETSNSIPYQNDWGVVHGFNSNCLKGGALIAHLPGREGQTQTFTVAQDAVVSHESQHFLGKVRAWILLYATEELIDHIINLIKVMEEPVELSVATFDLDKLNEIEGFSTFAIEAFEYIQNRTMTVVIDRYLSDN